MWKLAKEMRGGKLWLAMVRAHGERRGGVRHEHNHAVDRLAADGADGRVLSRADRSAFVLRSSYTPAEIINADETGIFYGAPPLNQYVPYDAARGRRRRGRGRGRGRGRRVGRKGATGSGRAVWEAS